MRKKLKNVRIGKTKVMAHSSQIRPYREVVWRYPNLLVTVKTTEDEQVQEPDSTREPATREVFKGRKRKHTDSAVPEVRRSKRKRKMKKNDEF